jgi:hypothetical protein
VFWNKQMHHQMILMGNEGYPGLRLWLFCESYISSLLLFLIIHLRFHLVLFCAFSWPHKLTTLQHIISHRFLSVLCFPILQLFASSFHKIWSETFLFKISNICYCYLAAMKHASPTFGFLVEHSFMKMTWFSNFNRILPHNPALTLIQLNSWFVDIAKKPKGYLPVERGCICFQILGNQG